MVSIFLCRLPPSLDMCKQGRYSAYMAETKRRHSDRGPVGDQVAKNLIHFRGERHKTTTQLASEVSDLGVPMTASTVTKIEKQGRRVTVDELVALAAALGVSPVTLMLPARDAGPVRLADKLTAQRWSTAWRWMHGEVPFIARKWVDVAPWLSWLAANRPYLSEEDMQRMVLAQPPQFSVELAGEYTEEEDHDPGS
jgi:transcriptional regulator with XRE-family HTH domain